MAGAQVATEQLARTGGPEVSRPGPGVEGVKSAARVMAIIDLLTKEHRGAGFSEICARLDLPKSSTHALLRTMTDRGFLTVDRRTRRYGIGVRVWEAGQAYLQGFDLPSIALPYMEAARDSLNETIQLAILDGVDNVYVAKVEADHRLALQSRVGARLPAYSTGLGKVLLAGLSDCEVRARFRDIPLEAFTDKTITDIELLINELHSIRQLNYGTDCGEYTPGIICAAVPVRAHSGAVVAAMSVSVPEVRAAPGSQKRALGVLANQAACISVQLGHRDLDQS